MTALSVTLPLDPRAQRDYPNTVPWTQLNPTPENLKASPEGEGFKPIVVTIITQAALSEGRCGHRLSWRAPVAYFNDPSDSADIRMAIP